MSLLRRRRPTATLSLSPDGPLRATETVTVTVHLDEAHDVTSAAVEIGYVNTYSYIWCGTNSPAELSDDPFIAAQQMGTTYGYTKHTTDWVPAATEPLELSGGELAAGTRTVALRLPSWSPGSSSVVTWEARLRAEKTVRDIDASTPFRVLVGPPSPLPTDLPVAQGGSYTDMCVFDLLTEHVAYRPGEEICGSVRITPRDPVDRTAGLSVHFTRLEESHPLTRAAAGTSETNTRPFIKVASGLALTQGVTTDVPFTVTLPDDLDPSTKAVHCSVTWCITVTLTFAGMTGGVERARREVCVYNA